jgi:hypothetical protein
MDGSLQLIAFENNERHVVVQWLRHCTTNQMVAGSIPDGHWNFSLIKSFRPHYGAGVDSASD